MNGGPVHGRLSRTSAAPGLVEHFFRREYGRLVALLTRKVGVRHIDVVEDAVQSALLAALTAWTTRAFPDDPSAWLYRVAHNNLIGEFRRKAGRRRILEQALVDVVESVDQPEPLGFAGEVRDDLLRMLFVCCDDAIPRESQLVFALKTLCGFSTGEIVLRLFTTEANVYKRLARARDRLRKADAGLQTPPLDALKSRLPSVHRVLYLLFNEGYLSANADLAIRRELCDEAIRLATLLAEHPVGAVIWHIVRTQSRSGGRSFPDKSRRPSPTEVELEQKGGAYFGIRYDPGMFSSRVARTEPFAVASLLK